MPGIDNDNDNDLLTSLAVKRPDGRTRLCKNSSKLTTHNRAYKKLKHNEERHCSDLHT